MDVTKVLTSLFGLAVITGAMIMILRNPSGTNALISASADTIAGVTTASEGR